MEEEDDEEEEEEEEEEEDDDDENEEEDEDEDDDDEDDSSGSRIYRENAFSKFSHPLFMSSRVRPSSSRIRPLNQILC